ncbi:metallo beta lactamase protein [Fusarium bulbicola]|nr:metallo beta lactamase protein [Fusarium bulbicola]
MTPKLPSLIEVDSLDVHVLINDEIDQISPSPNPRVQHAQSFAGVPLSPVSDPTKKGNKSHTLLFDTGPEEDVFEKNVQRLRLPMLEIGAIVLSHWHRDHSGGLLSAIRLASRGRSDGGQVIVALPPDKPALRGIMFDQPISLEPDPTIDDINSAGGKTVVLNEALTVLDDAFLISGEIPRQAEYEGGISGGVRYDPAKDEWVKDEFHWLHPIYAIVGGYHLADASPDKMEQSMKDLKNLEPVLLMPGHCTGWRFKGLIEKEMPGQMAPLFGETKYTL